MFERSAQTNGRRLFRATPEVAYWVTLPSGKLPCMTHAEQVAAHRKTLKEDVRLFDNEVRRFSNQLKKAQLTGAVPEVFQAVINVRRQALASALERLRSFEQGIPCC